MWLHANPQGDAKESASRAENDISYVENDHKEVNEAYSDLKAAYHTRRIEEIRAGRQIVPAQVQLIISDLCNQDCHFCAYRMSGGMSTEEFGEDSGKGFTMNPNRKIGYAKAIEILNDCAELGVEGIQFTGGGEPTVHPGHIGLFEHALRKGMKAALVTNFMKPGYGWQAVLPRFSWIRVSVDAGYPETYSKIRRVPEHQYGKVIGNLTELCEVAREQHSECLIGAGFVITPENYNEIVVGVANLRDAGVAYVRLSAMFSRDFGKPYKEIAPRIREFIAAAHRLETPTFKVVDLFGDRLSDLEQKAPDYDFCGYQQMNVYVGGNLKVYRCCTTSYTKHGEVGDLSHQSFREWFESEQKRLAYATFNARSCNLCQFNSKNRVINYLTQGRPTHVEFV